MAPHWSHLGWSPTSPGFVFWASTSSEQVLFGEDMLAAASRTSTMVRAHLFGHRYAQAHESIKDRLTYHALVVVEWDHGDFVTVVELAWRHGIGGCTSPPSHVNFVTLLFLRRYLVLLPSDPLLVLLMLL